MPPVTDPPDWRNADDYAPLAGLDRPAFAWELLRRDPAYRRDAAGVAPAGEAGLILVDPDAARLAARWGLSFPGGSAAGRAHRAHRLACGP
jgi:hypothetical protein